MKSRGVRVPRSSCSMVMSRTLMRMASTPGKEGTGGTQGTCLTSSFSSLRSHDNFASLDDSPHRIVPQPVDHILERRDVPDLNVGELARRQRATVVRPHRAG